MDNKKKAVFLDKDGTLILNVPYNVDPAKIRLSEGAFEALLALQGAGYVLVIITNQSGVARGLFTEKDLEPVRDHLQNSLAKKGIHLSGFYYCPHHPQGVVKGYNLACDCRKPEPGMLRQAAGELGIDLSRSWMIGDSPDDVLAGKKAGCRSILLYGSAHADGGADFVCNSLMEAAGKILSRD